MVIRRERPASYFDAVIPKLVEMGADTQRKMKACRVDIPADLIASKIGAITASDSETPEEDMRLWCKRLEWRCEIALRKERRRGKA